MPGNMESIKDSNENCRIEKYKIRNEEMMTITAGFIEQRKDQ